jgi:hypothetical protein
MSERSIPEARGPGVDAPDGSITYGVESPAGRVVITPPRPAAERDRDRAKRAANPRCDRCRDLPDDLVRAAVRIIRDAREGRPL